MTDSALPLQGDTPALCRCGHREGSHSIISGSERLCRHCLCFQYVAAPLLQADDSPATIQPDLIVPAAPSPEHVEGYRIRVEHGRSVCEGSADTLVEAMAMAGLAVPAVSPQDWKSIAEIAVRQAERLTATAEMMVALGLEHPAPASPVSGSTTELTDSPLAWNGVGSQSHYTTSTDAVRCILCGGEFRSGETKLYVNVVMPEGYAKPVAGPCHALCTGVLRWHDSVPALSVQEAPTPDAIDRMIELLRKEWHNNDCGALDVIYDHNCQCPTHQDVIGLHAIADSLVALRSSLSQAEQTIERLKGEKGE